MISKSIVVKGKVQGVFFRASAKRIAENLNIHGWVKNNSAGEVEIMVTGEESNIQEFILWCKKGPDKSDVKDVIVSDSNEIHMNNFIIIH
ncbi:MAG: acylphosphatase [Ferruginibacter sp.]